MPYLHGLCGFLPRGRNLKLLLAKDVDGKLVKLFMLTAFHSCNFGFSVVYSGTSGKYSPTIPCRDRGFAEENHRQLEHLHLFSPSFWLQNEWAGAKHVTPFDHNIRSATGKSSEKEIKVRTPV